MTFDWSCARGDKRAAHNESWMAVFECDLERDRRVFPSVSPEVLNQFALRLC